jgi:hypothetical protein
LYLRPIRDDDHDDSVEDEECDAANSGNTLNTEFNDCQFLRLYSGGGE